MTAMRTLVENAVVTALTPLLDPNLGGAAGGYLRKVAAYQGPLSNARPEDPEVKLLIERGTPCIGVATGDGAYDTFSGAQRENADLGFSIELLVLCGNQRNDVSKARGDGISDDPGAYEILEDVRALLWLDLGVTGAGIARPRSETALVRSGELAIWLVSYAIDTDALMADPAAGATVITDRDVNANNADDDAADPVAVIRTAV